ncbi:hypothetical protein S2091_1558 [Solimicrobium silvestre]|uniref:Uncharacterized protein n=1 Tax=Solimicrobium silvestre TaxID=2099400 RepID=A0A2S9H0R6_9BURK|nr:hypothetical protein S2091_1558 [Solimicrobium silvestre]
MFQLLCHGSFLFFKCRDCVKTKNKFEREKIDLLKRSLFNYFNVGNGFPTHAFSEKACNFLFLHIDGRPHFAKLLFTDVKKVEIAAIDPDF